VTFRSGITSSPVVRGTVAYLTRRRQAALPPSVTAPGRSVTLGRSAARGNEPRSLERHRSLCDRSGRIAGATAAVDPDDPGTAVTRSHGSCTVRCHVRAIPVAVLVLQPRASSRLLDRPIPLARCGTADGRAAPSCPGGATLTLGPLRRPGRYRPRGVGTGGGTTHRYRDQAGAHVRDHRLGRADQGALPPERAVVPGLLVDVSEFVVGLAQHAEVPVRFEARAGVVLPDVVNLEIVARTAGDAVKSVVPFELLAVRPFAPIRGRRCMSGVPQVFPPVHKTRTLHSARISRKVRPGDELARLWMRDRTHKRNPLSRTRTTFP